VLLVLAVLLFPLFPLAAVAERPVSLIVPVLSLGLAFFAGKFAVTGRAHRWPSLIGQFHVCKGIDPMDPILDFFNERPRENWKWQFMPDAAGHNAVNAVALANLALLAYSGTEGVRHFLVDNWTFSDLQPLAGESTQGFVARKEDVVFVAFRGTQPTSILDWLTDGKYHQKNLRNVPGVVHGGFVQALEQVCDAMLDAVHKLCGGEKPSLFVSGHSLGGALAVLAAAVLQFDAKREVSAVYTYGQPRVGNPEFSSAFDSKLGDATFRYVNDRSVPLTEMLPGRFPSLELEVFTHVGQLKLFLPDGSLTDSDEEWQQREIGPADAVAGLREVSGLLDHDPVTGYLPKLEAQLQLS
jgi:triacylglycerol lipase